MSPFIRGVAVFIVGMAFFTVAIIFLGSPGDRVPQITFKTVTQYKGCDVVEMDHEARSRYFYFLDCHESR